MLALAQQCAQALERARLYVEAHAANAAKSQFLAVVNDVLNLARVESGVARYDLRNIVLDDALAELETLIAPQAAHRGVRYTYRHVDRAVGVRVDVERLQQIVLNLLSNAVKFTESGGSVMLQCEAGTSDVVIRVIDTGCGVPSDKLDAIFEPFVQVNAELTRRAEGTGLGLAISRDLARAMGGLIAESVVGQGATFVLTLPRMQGPSPCELTSAPPSTNPAAGTPSSGVKV